MVHCWPTRAKFLSGSGIGQFPVLSAKVFFISWIEARTLAMLPPQLGALSVHWRSIYTNANANSSFGSLLYSFLTSTAPIRSFGFLSLLCYLARWSACKGALFYPMSRSILAQKLEANVSKCVYARHSPIPKSSQGMFRQPFIYSDRTFFLSTRSSHSTSHVDQRSTLSCLITFVRRCSSHIDW